MRKGGLGGGHMGKFDGNGGFSEDAEVLMFMILHTVRDREWYATLLEWPSKPVILVSELNMPLIYNAQRGAGRYMYKISK
jgi:hypothetical protein